MPTYEDTLASRAELDAHDIPLGALVELESGVRLFVVHQGRDCDQTPMYWLAATPDETERSRWTGGYSDYDLVVVSDTDASHCWKMENTIEPNTDAKPEQWAEIYAVGKLGVNAACVARDVVRDAFLAGYLIGILKSSDSGVK